MKKTTYLFLSLLILTLRSYSQTSYTSVGKFDPNNPQATITKIKDCHAIYSQDIAVNSLFDPVIERHVIEICPENPRIQTSFITISTDKNDDSVNNNSFEIYEGKFEDVWAVTQFKQELILTNTPLYLNEIIYNDGFKIMSKDTINGCLTVVWDVYTYDDVNIEIKTDCASKCKSIESFIDPVNIDGIKHNRFLNTSKSISASGYGGVDFLILNDSLNAYLNTNGIYGLDTSMPSRYDSLLNYEQSDELSSFNWIIDGAKGLDENQFTSFFVDQGLNNVIVQLSINDNSSGLLHDTTKVRTCEATSMPLHIKYISDQFDQAPFSSSDIIEVPLSINDLHFYPNSIKPEIVELECNYPNVYFEQNEPSLIPDGENYSGARLEHIIPCNYFNIQKGDIESLEIELEHSYVGDLSLILESPDGKQVKLLSPNRFNGASFGNPFTYQKDGQWTDADDGKRDNMSPQYGQAYKYIWSATEGIELSYHYQTKDDNLPNNNNAFPEGTVFKIEGDLDTFIDSPAHGIWKLICYDHKLGNNGFIKSFKINAPILEYSFSPQIPPNEYWEIYSMDKSLLFDFPKFDENEINYIQDEFIGLDFYGLYINRYESGIPFPIEDQPSKTQIYSFYWTDEPIFEVEESITHINIHNGINTGSVELSVANGLAPYTITTSSPHGQEGMRFTQLESGQHEFTIIDAVGNMESHMITIKNSDIVLGSIDAKNNISIDPNPFEDYMLINNSKYLNSLQITDLQGKAVIELDNDIPKRLDTSQLSSGIYMIICVTDEGNQTFKLIKK
ncbi:T9SS type A sorting domain-containing protein [Aureibacter tunicatorum]|uniref:Subtilisin-like proprotein convertase family protein n=1 Tax=Aureibacter tunicatorum TaxID=866807 RepID=A0AAE3XM97_9BACT|nr:T9SS type A sorting domain-containing protein [Aureibacter tunicatorum]MDR6238530.1 subtilisin-like proprotein convertase family protein [Aureibacter tunicatorum]BDD05538.1 hypothetical protein AUTU_30210 [Aureibacter tunicatorum]